MVGSFAGGFSRAVPHDRMRSSGGPGRRRTGIAGGGRNSIFSREGDRTVRLYLVRHGEAVSGAEDPDRPLSPEGRNQAERTGAMLARLGVQPTRIEYSVKTRARETAEGIAEALGAMDRLSVRKGLKPNDPVDPLAGEFGEGGEDRMVVGHLPFLEKLAATLLAGSSEALRIRFAPAAAACLFRGPDGAWSLEWLAGPDLLEG